MAKVELKKEMEKEINKGIDLLIQRKSNSIQCRCFQSITQAGKSNCPICLGEGVLYRVQREKAVLQKQNVNSTNEIKNTNLGEIDQSIFNLFLKSKIKPKINDKIFLSSWDVYGPVKLQNTLKITKILPIINDFGIVSLYNVVATNSPKDFGVGKKIINKARQYHLKIGDGFYVRPI